MNSFSNTTADIFRNSKTKSQQHLQKLIDNLPNNKKPFFVYTVSSDDVKKAVKSLGNNL